MSDYHYEGQELHLFEKAVKWKQYLATHIKPYIQGKVLEVGAGIGETTLYLQNRGIEEWTCLEPDSRLLSILQKKISTKKLPVYCTARLGTVETLHEHKGFDTIIYIDVLEHIEDDAKEIKLATSLLNTGGSLIILSPAYPLLYSSFDKAIGHYRRYSKKTLRSITAALALKEIRLYYLDSASILLLFLNKLLVKKSYPSSHDIWIWQTFFLPVSKILDRLVLRSTGKSIVGVWRKH